MMELLIFSFYDEKAAAFLTPWCAPTVAHAERTFFDAVQDVETLFGQHPEDFSLHQLGRFDVRSGKLEIAASSLGNGVRHRMMAEVLP